MPKINEYAVDGTISVDDFLLGSDADDLNKTRSYKISDILSFFSGTINSSDFEGYTESGTRSLSTLVTILGDYDDSGRGTKITINDISGLIDLESFLGYIKLTQPNGIARIDFSGLTAERIVAIQDGSGTFAYLSDVFSGAYADLSGTPSIPAATSDLTNDGDSISAFATVSSLPTAVSELTNDTGFITSASLPTAVSDLTNDTGFITSASLPTTTSDLTNDGADGTSTYVENDEIQTVATSGSYNDLSDQPTIKFPNVSVKTTDYTAVDQDDLLVDASGQTITITLPAAAIGAIIAVCKTDATANTVTVDGNGAETINGATTQVLTSQYDSIKMRSDGTSWFLY